MSKAFTREDDVADEPIVPVRRAVRLTAHGAKVLANSLAELDPGDPAAARLRELLAHATVVEGTGEAVAGFGARVSFRDGAGKKKRVVLVSAEEVGLVPQGVSIGTPLAHALAGARVGDKVEIDTPREDELTVLAVEWP